MVCMDDAFVFVAGWLSLHDVLILQSVSQTRRMSWTAKSGNPWKTKVGFWSVMSGRRSCGAQMKTEGQDPRHSFILSLFLLYLWTQLLPSRHQVACSTSSLLSGLRWNQFRNHCSFHMGALEDVLLTTCVGSPLLLTSNCLTRCHTVSGVSACDFPFPPVLQSGSLFSVQVSEDDHFRFAGFATAVLESGAVLRCWLTVFSCFPEVGDPFFVSLTNVCSRFVVSPVRPVPLGAFIRSGYLALFVRVFPVTSLFWPTLPKCVTNSSQMKSQASSDFSEFEHNLWSTSWMYLASSTWAPWCCLTLLTLKQHALASRPASRLDIVSL